jgi:hypothetical protein
MLRIHKVKANLLILHHFNQNLKFHQQFIADKKVIKQHLFVKVHVKIVEL